MLEIEKKWSFKKISGLTRCKAAPSIHHLARLIVKLSHVMSLFNKPIFSLAQFKSRLHYTLTMMPFNSKRSKLRWGLNEIACPSWCMTPVAFPIASDDQDRFFQKHHIAKPEHCIEGWLSQVHSVYNLQQIVGESNSFKPSSHAIRSYHNALEKY